MVTSNPRKEERNFMSRKMLNEVTENLSVAFRSTSNDSIIIVRSVDCLNDVIIFKTVYGVRAVVDRSKSKNELNHSYKEKVARYSSKTKEMRELVQALLSMKWDEIQEEASLNGQIKLSKKALERLLLMMPKK